MRRLTQRLNRLSSLDRMVTVTLWLFSTNHSILSPTIFVYIPVLLSLSERGASTSTDTSTLSGVYINGCFGFDSLPRRFRGTTFRRYSLGDSCPYSGTLVCAHHIWCRTHLPILGTLTSKDYTLSISYTSPRFYRVPLLKVSRLGKCT